MKRWIAATALLTLAACSAEKPATPDTQSGARATAATMTITSKSPEAIEHFRKGGTLFDNLRTAEAAAEFTKALELDPDFALARALAGQNTPGPEGLKQMEQAAQAAASLPEAERAYIEGLLAGRRNEPDRARTSFTRVTQLAPGDPHGFVALGSLEFGQRNFAAAVQALKKATEIDPNDGAALNQLGYAALLQGDTEGAIANFTKYAQLLPQEPNAQDSLGEALLAAGKFTDAEAAFRKAAALSPQFWNAWQGVAYVKFYSGDPEGANEALAKARDAAQLPNDKVTVDTERAALTAAAGNQAQALSILGTAAKTADALPQAALVPVFRGILSVEAGRPRDALADINSVLKRADSGELPASLSRNLRVQALRARATAETAMGDAAAAAKTSAALADEAKQHPDDLLAQSAMHFAEGAAALAKKDYRVAADHFGKCDMQDYYCQMYLVDAAQRAGDTAKATSVRDALMKLYVRNPVYATVRARLSAKPAPRTT
jgi:tetratricopeptide (TPR) repeat protein